MIVFDEKNGTVRTDYDGFLESTELEFEVNCIKPAVFQEILRVNRYLDSLYDSINVPNSDIIGLFITEP